MREAAAVMLAVMEGLAVTVAALLEISSFDHQILMRVAKRKKVSENFTYNARTTHFSYDSVVVQQGPQMEAKERIDGFVKALLFVAPGNGELHAHSR
jgi:hypothetical protein